MKRRGTRVSRSSEGSGTMQGLEGVKVFKYLGSLNSSEICYDVCLEQIRGAVEVEQSGDNVRDVGWRQEKKTKTWMEIR